MKKTTMKTTFVFCLLVLNLLTNGVSVMSQGKQPYSQYPETDTSNLKKIIDGTVDFSAAQKILIGVGQMPKGKFNSLLKEIAISKSIGNDPLLSLYALKSLKKAGEPDKFFIDNILNYKANSNLTIYSITVLSYAPNANLLELLSSIEQDLTAQVSNNKEIVSKTNENQRRILASINRAKYVFYNSKKYNDLQYTPRKVEFLLELLGSGCGYNITNDDAIDIILNPHVIWVRETLRVLSIENPKEVAKTIFETDVRKRFEKDLALLGDKTYGQKEYRKYVSNFICLKAKKALYDLVNQARAQEMKKQ